MIARILSFLFPPRCPGRVRDWVDRFETTFVEQGSVEHAKPRQYRDGIDRYFTEEDVIP